MWKILESKRLALWLIAFLALEISLINSKIAKGVYLDSLFLFTAALFWLNCFCCTIGQTQRAWQNFNKRDFRLKGKEVLKTSIKQDDLQEAIRSVKKSLVTAPFRVKSSKSTTELTFIAERNPWGLWGMVIFHIAILWTILGAIWGDLNKVEGNFFIEEGLSVKELHEEYAQNNEGILFREKHSGFEIKIHRINLNYQGRKAPELAGVDLSINQNGQEVFRKSMSSKEMVDYQDYKLSFGERGYAPILEVASGGEPSYHSLSLRVHQTENGGESYQQKVFINDLQKDINFSFFPTPPNQNKEIDDYKINNPMLQLTYLDELGKQQIKTIGLNDSIIINGQKVTMIDAKPWIEIISFKRPGIYIVYFGFAMALVGLFVYYGLPYQKITINITRAGEIIVSTYTKLNSVEFNKQVENIIEEITKFNGLKLNNQWRKDEGIW